MMETMTDLVCNSPSQAIIGLGSLITGGIRAISSVGRTLLGGGVPAVQGQAIGTIQRGAGAVVRRIGGNQVIPRVGTGAVRAGVGRAVAGGVATGGAIVGGEALLTGGGGGPGMPGSDAQGYVDGMPIYVGLMSEQRLRAPRGYVVVTDPVSGQKYGMLRKAAVGAGLWKPRRKPPISAAEWRQLQRAGRTADKAIKVTAVAAKVRGKKVVSRTAGTRRTSSRARR